MNINRVVLVGNLTHAPELRSAVPSIYGLRLAVTTRHKVNGEWADKPNYFNVTVFGAQGEKCALYLSKGSPVAVDGRLEWREFVSIEGVNRQSVEIIADNVQFLGSKEATPVSTSPPVDDEIPF